VYLIKKSIKIKYRGRISPTRTMFQSQCRIFVTTVTEVVASWSTQYSMLKKHFHVRGYAWVK